MHPDDLVSYVVLAVGPYSDGGKPKTAVWPNPTGRELKIVRARAGSWFQYGLRCDAPLAAFRTSDGTLIIDGGVDHYAEPSLPFQGWPQDFSPNAFYLGASDSITVVYGFVPFQGTPSVVQNVTIWCPRGN